MKENIHNLSPNLILQYSIVGLILILAFSWLLWKMIRNRKIKESGPCCGCSMADSCKKKISPQNSRK